MVLFSSWKSAPSIMVLTFFCGVYCSPAAEPNLSANEVIQKAVARAKEEQSDAGKPGYTYTKVSVTEELDAAGKIKEHKEKVSQVLCKDGATQVHLLEVNGHAPRQADLRKQGERELSARQLLGESKGGGNLGADLLTPELLARFDFKLVRQDPINGRSAYRIDFQPKDPEPPIRHIVDKFLNRLSGSLWIDAEEYELARAEIRLRSEVDLLGGAVGCLRHLAYTLVRTRMMEGVWLNSFSSGDFEGRKLLDSLRIKTKTELSNFRLLAMNS